jgi:two-component system NtrC family sensor kinase
MTTPNRRILLVDDMPAIHADFRKILRPEATAAPALDDFEAALFGDEAEAVAGTGAVSFEVDSAHQGQDTLKTGQRGG